MILTTSIVKRILRQAFGEVVEVETNFFCQFLKKSYFCKLNRLTRPDAIIDKVNNDQGGLCFNGIGGE